MIDSATGGSPQPDIPQPGIPQLRVRSDLQLEIGPARATLVADGHDLVLATDDPGSLLAQATDAALMLPGGSSLRSLVSGVARGLEDAGLAVRVTAPRGTLVELGRGCDSRVGRLLFGTDHARLGSPGALVPAIAGYASASASVRRRVRHASAGVVVAALLVGAGLRRRTTAGN